MRSLGLAPTCDPSPMTREGTRAMVERFHALKRRQVREGGGGGTGGSTTPIPSGPKKTKSIHASRRSATAVVSVPRKKTKTLTVKWDKKRFCREMFGPPYIQPMKRQSPFTIPATAKKTKRDPHRRNRDVINMFDAAMPVLDRWMRDA
jgi:hypothetical protein